MEKLAVHKGRVCRRTFAFICILARDVDVLFWLGTNHLNVLSLQIACTFTFLFSVGRNHLHIYPGCFQPMLNQYHVYGFLIRSLVTEVLKLGNLEGRQ